jgi:uncharacterized membrane protein
MNKWFKLALNSFIGIIVLNLVFSLLFGGSLGFGLQALAPLIVLVVKILNITLVVGLVLGIYETLKTYLAS